MAENTSTTAPSNKDRNSSSSKTICNCCNELTYFPCEDVATAASCPRYENTLGIESSEEEPEFIIIPSAMNEEEST